MRSQRLVAFTVMTVLVGPLMVGFRAPIVQAAGDDASLSVGVDAGLAAALKEEAQLAEFEAKAEAAGALGFYRDDQGGELVVVVPAGDAADFALRDLGEAPFPVKVQLSTVDARALAVAQDKLYALEGKQLTATDSMAFAFNPRLERIEVSTSLDAATLSDALGDSWNLIEYRKAGAGPSSRFNDLPPFWGGAAINFVNYRDPYYDCTSGFTVVNSAGKRGLVTAGHCGPVDWDVRTPAGVLVGHTENKHCSQSPNNSDVQLIAGQSYGGKIYVGGLTGTGRLVTNAGSPQVGFQYRMSGATTYESPNLTVTSLNGSWWADICGLTFWVLNLVVYRLGASTPCPGDDGDSGGPLYLSSADHVGIRGMYVAKDINGGPNCYAMNYNRISQLLGYSIYLE